MKKNLIVECVRDWDGQIFSQVRVDPEPPKNGGSIVIDRAKGRQMDAKTIKNRAQSLAKLLGLPFKEDYTWHCKAMQKLACRCPECVKEGRA